MEANLTTNLSKCNVSIPIYSIRLLSNRPNNPTARKITKRCPALSLTLKLIDRFNKKLVDMPTKTEIQLATM